ncbi:unnamed protein product, partial [Symbiodinium microadriaticum]
TNARSAIAEIEVREVQRRSGATAKKGMAAIGMIARGMAVIEVAMEVVICVTAATAAATIDGETIVVASKSDEANEIEADGPVTQGVEIAAVAAGAEGSVGVTTVAAATGDNGP